MRKFICLILAVVLAASMSVIAVSAADDTATVTLIGLKGETVTRTYAVGDTFYAYTYLNLTPTGTTNACSLKGTQTYSDSILEVADAFDDDEESYNYGAVTDVDAMLPVCGGIANVGRVGEVHFNASTAATAGFQFVSDDSALIVVQYTVKAAGNATISNSMRTLAINDYSLTRIIDKGSIVNDKFICIVELSEAIPPVVSGYTLSGAITSYATTQTASADVTVTLTGTDNNHTDSVTGTEAYSFASVPAGSYVLSVAKDNHATREYEVTVSEATTLDVKICPIGDVNGDGKVTNFDYAKVNQHVCKIEGKIIDKDDYAFKCADVNNDGNVTNFDSGKINQHVCKVKSLWTV